MAAPCSILFLLIVLVISLHRHLQVNSQYNSSFERTLLSSLNQHWGYPVPLYEAWHSNSSSSPCDWPYVDCNDDHMVTVLSLSQKDISGTIPSSICQLKHLVSVDLSGNDITGPIPAGIGDCTSLQSLDLSWNHISGAIPGELFLLERLVNLSLLENTLQGFIPTTIEKAVSLERLDLSRNYGLNGSIPDGITRLHNLRRLDLSRNSLSGEIPTRLFSIRRIEYLSLSYNNLSGPLTSYIDFKSSTFLKLAHSRLSGLILKFNFGEVNKADMSPSYLGLSHNNLSGEIADFVYSLARFTAVNLCENNFAGMLPSRFRNEYIDSCFDPSNICSEEGTTDQSFPSCPSSLCSYVIFQGYKMCTRGFTHKKSYAVFIVALAIAVCYFARKCMKNRKSEWKMFYFKG